MIEEPGKEHKDVIHLHSASLERKMSENKVIIPINSKKTGAIIGFLERALILLFINIGQFSAIGLVLTAKSIVRYDMISKNQQFSEYYLIGTLTSFLSAILAFYILVY